MKHLGIDPGKDNFAMVMLDDAGRSIFGAIDQVVTRAERPS